MENFVKQKRGFEGLLSMRECVQSKFYGELNWIGGAEGGTSALFYR
jgi:hypothetical protein